MMEISEKDLTIYYDYSGIEKWATKEWKRNKKGTIEYSEYIDSVKLWHLANNLVYKFEMARDKLSW